MENIDMKNMSCTCEQALHPKQKNWVQLTFSKLLVWKRNYRTRRHLRELPKHLWSDVGLDEQTVVKEIGKPFWRGEFD